MQSFGGGFNSIALGVGDGRPHCYGAYRATIGANGGRACPNVYLPGVGKTQPADDVRCVGGVSGSPATAAPAAQQANPGHEIAPKVAMATRFSATTLMLRNLPRRVTLEILVAELDVSGFLGVWDFLYCPRYKITGACKGFAFLNFHTSVMAKAFLEDWEASQRFGMQGRHKISVSEAKIQGFEANVARLESGDIDGTNVLILRDLATVAPVALSTAASMREASRPTNAEPSTSRHAAMEPRQQEVVAFAPPPDWVLPMPTFL